MATFTSQKIHLVNLNYFVGAFVFLFAAGYAFLQRRSHPNFHVWQIITSLCLATLVASFPLLWAIIPRLHPVRRALAAHGDPKSIEKQLDADMKCLRGILGPFHFGDAFMVYSPGYTIDVIPYECILSASWELERTSEPPATPTVVVHTKDGRTYRWYRTWMQGSFDAAQVLDCIRAGANLTTKIGSWYYRPTPNT